jgi:primosomal protein N' (replication factor Y)
MPFVRVAVNLPAVSGEFDYEVPEALAGIVGAGHLVTVPFGNQVAQGIVLEIVSQPAVARTKSVIDLLDSAPVLSAAQVAFARQLARETLNPLAAIVDLMIPPGLTQHVDTVYERTTDHRPQTIVHRPSSVVNSRLLDLIKTRGPLRGRQIDRHFARVDWRKSAQALVRQGVLTSKSVLPPVSVRPKFIRTVQLAVLPEVAEAAMPTLGKTPSTLERRQKALRCLVREPQAVNVSWVYAESGCTLADLQELAERELIVLGEAEIFRDPLVRDNGQRTMDRGWEIVLTSDQEAALAEILPSFTHSPNHPITPFLLHGVTGSGKTEIYLRATAEALRRGKQALILVPEIALTPQTVRRFTARFPGQVGLVHSKLSDGERYDTWRRARSGQLSIIIGARSALFAPLANIGLIVADECHDGSYYQSEPPFYDAVSAAQMYARISGAVCILGSATPPVALKYETNSPPLFTGEGPGVGAVSTVHLPTRLTPLEAGGVSAGTSLPPVKIVDMREELKAGRRGIFSRALAESLAETLERGEQAILFLNRRGTATYVFCRDCGYVAKCPNCDTPLTFHVEGLKVGRLKGDLPSNLPTFKLVCHRCAYARNMLKKCPQCESSQIREYGLGSERVEHEVQTLFPSARVLRWDWETTREKDAHELILTHFANHNADILVGTQMLAKGLDLPLVTLVGIVLADVGLNLPDPFAAERAFQVLTQVAGRAGRSSRGGRVVLQTFQPEHYAIQAAAGHDYAAFYEREIAYRRELGYPPFGRLLRLEFRDKDNAEAEKAALALAERLTADIKAEKRIQTDLIGPVPCFFAKVNGVYRWQIILRGPQPVSLLKGKLPVNWRVEVDPISLL